MVNGGIFAQAEKAKLETRGGQVEEQAETWKAEIRMRQYSGGLDKSIRELLEEKLEELNEQGLLTDQEVIDILKDANIERTVDIGSRNGEKAISFKIDEIKTADIKEYFIFIVEIPEDNKNYTLSLPYNGQPIEYNFEVQWGDGATTEVTTLSDTDKTHEYTVAGEYEIKIKGIAEGGISFTSDDKLKRLMTGFPESMNVTRKDFRANFSGCDNLIGSIPEDLFAYTPEVTDFSNVFAYNDGLTGPIPGNLFKNTENVTDFSYAFFECRGLTESIPGNLFASTSKVITFKKTFSYCQNLAGAIPAELFANTPNVTDFTDTFNFCSKLTESIPATLFEKTTNVTSFNGTFSYCGGLTGDIPPNLFANTPNVTNFATTFYYCGKLTGPAIPLWERSNVTKFNMCYSGCTSLSDFNTIPSEWKELVYGMR